MPIQILPARLANQIAAGEVVERPASVVKELVENSLDAGADRIEVDIERGGAKLLRIRDNGTGIAKDELTLALSRHATSKVSTLEDLEQILSLGFRGEALASIGSVSRLVLTSRPAEQAEAWQAMAEGRDMAVKVQPASHPQGTTVEVSDLFFNTPARRKFLRTEKTEFAHIDEVVRRIALSRFEVSLSLKHNGKPVRQYRAAKLPSQQDKRLAAVCGPAFIGSALRLDSEHHGLRLWGWLSPADAARSQADLQYTYVNGRMMRDKLLNHAIRQAYGERLAPDTSPAFVLYLELDPGQVDVNVHPAKHEVRFHQARLVHDFIYQVLVQALEDAPAMAAVSGSAHRVRDEDHVPVPAGVRERALEFSPPNHGYAYAGGSGRGLSGPREQGSSLSRQTWQGLDALLTTVPADIGTAVPPDGEDNRALLVVRGCYLVAGYRQALWLCDLNRARAHDDGLKLHAVWQQGLVPQPLLLPVSVPVSPEQQAAIGEQGELLQKLGLELKSGSRGTIILTRVPQPLRHADLARLIPRLLERLIEDLAADPQALCIWLAEQGQAVRTDWSLAEAQVQWQRLLQLHNGDVAELACVQALAIEQQIDRWLHGE
ncbi:DNA mismatch repair endonuclease MutL [Zobellella aerophila]|uniref:DNA mismatch repair protein MutL n=1 Tax=Zobellella aerophila TaxID=870480 RepID=A0ABP6WDQ8_9GAMM